MNPLCRSTNLWVLLALVGVLVVVLLLLIVRYLWRPVAAEKLQDSSEVWQRILSHVGFGLALAVALLGFLYGGCASFANTCWQGGFCEAAWRGPPWILVSGLAAAPAAILLWHWRTVQRAIDQSHKERELANGERTQRAQDLASAASALNHEHESARVAAVFAVFAVGEKDIENYGLVAIHVLSSYVTEASRTGEARFSIESAFRCAAILSAKSGRPLQLRGASLQGANLSTLVVPPGSSLEGLDLFNGSARSASFAGCILRQARMTNSDLSKACLDKAALESATLNDCCLIDASLRGVLARGTDFRESTLMGAQLQGAHLSKAQMQGANLDQADLTDANLSGALFDIATTFPEGFEPLERGMKLIAKTDK